MTEEIKKLIVQQSSRVREFEKIGLPEKGEQKIIISDDSFNALTFLIYITEKGEPIEELILSFYFFNSKSMEYIHNLLKMEIVKKFVFQTSDLRKYGADVQVPRKLSSMIKEFGADRISGSFINSHAKIMLCKTSNNFYVIEGSGNLSETKKLEQYILENSKESYEFHENWITTNPKREVIK